MLRKFLAIIEDTIREGLAKKTILGMLIVSTLAIIVAALLFQMDSVQHGLLSPSTGHVQMGKSQPVQMLGVTVLDAVWMTISMLLLLTAVFVGTFVTAGFITSMMEKGTIDLLLSKPVPRWLYVVGRYCGSVFIVLIEVAYLVLGLWLVGGISLGAWGPAFLSSIVLITLTFAGVFALVTLIGILTRSSWFALIIGLALYIIAGLVVPIGQFFDRLMNGGDGGGFLTTVASILHYSIPSEGMGLTLTSVLIGTTVNMTPIFLTAGLTIVYVALSCYAFEKKEF